MVHRQLKRQHSGLPQMESLSRFSSIPVVETGIKTAGSVYERVKTSNGLLTWGFETAESLTYALIDSLRPATKMIQGPLHQLDSIMCKSLDLVEQKVPSMYLPPEMMFWNTKEYMSDHLMKPVLSRANSMKNLGHAVLESRVSNYAAGRIDGALVVCDKYVERYLPTEPQDQPDYYQPVSLRRARSWQQRGYHAIPLTCMIPSERMIGLHATSHCMLIVCPSMHDRMGPGQQYPVRIACGAAPPADDSNEMHVVKTFHRGQQLSRKLKRRLTFRTRQELSALKKQSTEAVHVVAYAAELIATNPREALQKAVELWRYLSKDEPENQARPRTLEQVAVLLTRESARKMVHLINFVTGAVTRVPKAVRAQTRELVHHFLFATERLMKTVHLEKAKAATLSEASGLVHRIQHTYDDLQNQTNLALHGQLSLANIDRHDFIHWLLLKVERLAVFLSGRLEAEKITTSGNPRRRIQPRTNSNPMNSNINGVY
ncbi:lipid storage droplets surface-binding protein 1 isoform X2 [Anopheles arabiensis]|uniref:lipid storage droplets surface-binding protein 1 isoform X2 n=1 Tax=Anopheles arabiensis TaxID=7173 RepID=UPI001AADC28A|nr:lipid storage droplets surface-binding protein 1 isoform X2 [Anopheles arabiensis]